MRKRKKNYEQYNFEYSNKKILFIFLTNILKAPFNISLTYISNFIGKHESGKSIKHPRG